MKISGLTSKIFPEKNKYALKFFISASLVILVPLATLVYFIMSRSAVTRNMQMLGVAAIAVTIILLLFTYKKFAKYTKPINDARKALKDYATDRKIPQFDISSNDETGMLLTDIQESLQQIDSILTEKSDMIDLLSHDLRSPVTRIMGLSNLINMDADPEIVGYSEMILNECKNLLTLVENVMLMFKEGVNAFEPQNVNLLELITETVAFFNIAASDKKLKMVVDVDNNLFINVQHGLFTQALRNILGNAIKFSLEDKSIFISASRNDNKVIITIRDEGLGMKQSDVGKIFERFTKAGKKGTHGEASFGLGLYLSKKIIEKQGGEISAESKGSNKGAVFTITLNQLITKKRK